MAHFAKYTNSQVGHLFNHYNRDKEKDCERSNKNIDKEETRNNYNLMERDCTPQEYFNQRMGEVHCLDRANVNVMVDIVITLPKDYNGDRGEFFTHSVDFLNQRYGADNCIGAFVHLDEKTPHLHYSFIPVVPDHNPKHEKDLKVNAKAVVSRTELKAFHPELQEHLREKMPDRTINIYQEEKDRIKNLSIREYKAFKDEERIAHKEKEIHEKEIYTKSKERDLSERLDSSRQFERYFDRVEQYKSERDMTDREYYMQCWKASQGYAKYPIPERDNPERAEKLKENPERFEAAQKEHSQEREHSHLIDRDR